MSDNQDHYLADGTALAGLKTHSLLVHYVACHREEIPVPALSHLGALTEHAEPSAKELQAP